MTSILDAGLPDNSKPLVEANNDALGNLQLHVNSLYSGYGLNKQEYWANYRPQSGVSGDINSSQFDILITPTSGNGSIDIIDRLYLQLALTPDASGNATEFALKPLHHMINRIELSIDGGAILQILYGDQLFADIVANSTVSNLDDIKAQINLDPRNYLNWFDNVAKSANPEINSTGNIVGNSGSIGRSCFMSQSYFKSEGTFTDTLPVSPDTAFLENYCAFAKGGILKCPVPAEFEGAYNFYIPLYNTIMQQAKILLSALKANIRLRFYMNNQCKLYDSGVGASVTNINIKQASLWASGSRLSNEGLAALTLKYQNPVVSAFNYYLEFSQSFETVNVGSFTECVLSPITGMCNLLLFYLQDDRPDQLYPTLYKQNNMMTLPMDQIQFVNQDGEQYAIVINKMIASR